MEKYDGLVQLTLCLAQFRYSRKQLESLSNTTEEKYINSSMIEVSNKFAGMTLKIINKEDTI